MAKMLFALFRKYHNLECVAAFAAECLLADFPAQVGVDRTIFDFLSSIKCDGVDFQFALNGTFIQANIGLHQIWIGSIISFDF